MVGGVTETSAEIEPFGDDAGRGDGMLAILVTIVNDNDSSMSVTLTLPGGPVTGTLIGYNEWLELSEAQTPGFFAPYIESETARRARVDAEGDDARSTDLPPFYLHLKNARYFSGRLVPDSGNGFLWRGRISQVAAWSIGELGLSASS